MTKKGIRSWLVVSLTVLLMSCGGSTSDGNDDGSGGGGDGGDDTPPPTGGDVTEPVFRIGSFGTSGTFNEGEIEANQTNLAAGESASLVVDLVDENEAPVTEETEVFFTSSCINSGTSEVEPAIATNSSGTVSVTYTARGCDGTDTVTARTNLGGNMLTATVDLQTEQAPLGSIQFVSANPNLIGIQGSGALQEQAVVTFKVTNSSGGPVANQDVDFSLNTQEGGIDFNPKQNTTNADGLVTTTVTAGTVSTTVRVTASAVRDGVTVSAQSSALAVTTGIPDENSFSISTDVFNIEGWSFDGETAQITILAADRFNNPVPDDTAINFTTEGGSIDSTCLTVGGACSVTLTSQDPRPSDGRVTVLATATGEESFVDANPSNGQFDDGETFSDLPEAFLDENFDGDRQSHEPYRDFNQNGSYDAVANNLFEGLLCNGPTECATEESVHVREQIEIIFSGSSLIVSIDPSPIDLNGGSQTVTVEVVDARGQKPPAGTTVSVEATQGSIIGLSSFEQQSTNAPGPGVFSFLVEPGDEDDNGVFSVEVLTPAGIRSTNSALIDQTP